MLSFRPYFLFLFKKWFLPSTFMGNYEFLYFMKQGNNLAKMKQKQKNTGREGYVCSFYRKRRPLAKSFPHSISGF